MCQEVNLLLIIVLLCNHTLANRVSTCGEQVINDTNGIIKFSSRPEETIHCNWTIVTLEKSITSIMVIRSIVVKSEELSSICLTIEGSLKRYLQTCTAKLISSARLSVREQDILVNIESVNIYSNLWVAYASRNETECSNSDFQCLDKSNCYNLTNTYSRDIICNDHSDKLAFGKCNEVSVPCNQDFGICFNMTQRCDGVVNCPSGEDEFNCSRLCPNLIKCPRENKCIRKSDVCDRTINCSDNFDEENCKYKTSNSNIFIITVLFVVCSFSCIFFVCLVFRWVVTKRDMNRFLDNLPEIPLAPFQGPGENDDSSSSDLFEVEFRQGGEIYEHYMQSLNRKRHSSKAVQVGGLVPKFSHLELDAENEVIVLASLNVPSDMCVGLTISESSIESIKTLKSARKCNKNDSCSSATPPASLDAVVLEYNPEIRSVRSRTSPRVKFALTLDANSDTRAASSVCVNKRGSKSKALIVETDKPKANLAGGDFFILRKANEFCSENWSDSVKKIKSAPSPRRVNDAPTMASSKSLGDFKASTVNERDISCQRKSNWKDFAEEVDDTRIVNEPTGIITVKTLVEKVENR